MELCTIRGALSTPAPLLSSSRSFVHNYTHLRFQKHANISGVIYNRRSGRLLRASIDESSSKFSEEKSEAVVATLKDEASSKYVDEVGPANVTMNESQVQNSSSDDDLQQPIQEIFNNLNIDLDVEDSPTILLYGGGALVAVWLVSAIVNAIDSIPVFPKLMEVVGLGYSVWFTTRYLLFKKNREELGSKIEQLKQEIFGSNN